MYFCLQLWQLKTLFRQMNRSEDENLMKKKSAATLTRTMIPTCYRNPIARPVVKTVDCIYDNWKRIWVIVLWANINSVLFMYKFDMYRKSEAFQVNGYCLCVAKGTAEDLAFNMALILIPVCRRTLTRLRSTFLKKFFPFDDNINFHKVIALAIAIQASIHTALHIGCNYWRISTCPTQLFMNVFGPNFNYKQPSYMDLMNNMCSISGIVMIILMAISFTLATHWFRRNIIKFPGPFRWFAGFNAFWYAHHLLVIVYVFLVIHGLFLIFQRPWYTKTVTHIFNRHLF